MKKLFRAIEDNDFGMVSHDIIWLTCFTSQIMFSKVKYLFGWQEPRARETSDRSSQEFCHPLCQCEKCSKLRKVTKK